MQQQLTSQSFSPCICDTSAKKRLLVLDLSLPSSLWWNWNDSTTYDSHKSIASPQELPVHVHDSKTKKINKASYQYERNLRVYMISVVCVMREREKERDEREREREQTPKKFLVLVIVVKYSLNHIDFFIFGWWIGTSLRCAIKIEFTVVYQPIHNR